MPGGGLGQRKEKSYEGYVTCPGDLIRDTSYVALMPHSKLKLLMKPYKIRLLFCYQYPLHLVCFGDLV